MSSKKKKLPQVATSTTQEGYVYTFDIEGRLCLDCKNRERVILIHDLRAYDAGLHIGALGWTIPDTSDGYSVVDVQFDVGKVLRLKRYIFERINPDMEQVVVSELLSRYRNTRFDANSVVAERCRRDWILKTYGSIISFNETVCRGAGDQEVYAFTFPSLRELSQLRGDPYYPVKIGYTKDLHEGAYGRIQSQILEKAAYPEKPEVLLVWRTWDGRDLETQAHRKLRACNRKVVASLGSEWFLSSREELIALIADCNFAELPSDRIVTGARETLAEGFAELMAGGATIEMSTKGGALRIGIRQSSEGDPS